MYEAMQTLFGYGHAGARFWVVGLEEHCDNAADIQQRIEVRTANPQTFLDIEAFHIAVQGAMPAIERVSVWRIAREIYRGVYDADTEIGRLDPQISDLLLSEILPLPRSQTNQWPAVYHQWFATSNEYVVDALLHTVPRLINMVKEHSPEVVILHGKTQHDGWIEADPELKSGWKSEPVVDQPKHTVLWRFLNNTLLVRTNNLVNTGFVRFGPAQINQLVELIHREVGLEAH
ncbi:hypothetical protein KTQ42_15580|uniref:hypothetical protein n=1 Tax=Noviherbaspirillum sp. L7-7A TaxID=2850560 RepID=UPI001C2BA3DB|nr:hypothetical protein [Noviherbaspirillum sp. L7-7A]MBV0880722.1 hypothetical protein [Noviherbaspirillum sp. L7-7A]